MSTPGPAAAALTAGFADPVRDAQAGFRALLEAMARPGRIAALPMPAEPPPPPLMPAAAAIALSLCDADTPVWLDATLAAGGVPGWLRFHCGCPLTDDPRAAAFAFAAGPPPPLAAFDPGSDLFPDRATTLVLQLAALDEGAPLLLSGPGLREGSRVRAAGLPADFVAQRTADRALYPRGIDSILVAGRRALCLPRSTIVQAA